MATLATETRAGSDKVGIIRFALTGALASITVFAICWLGAALGIKLVTHMYIGLFTDAEMSSGLALLQGACLAFLSGLVGGGLIAFFYNLLGWSDGR